MNDDELHARLRAADPAASLTPADPDRVAELLADVMSTEPTTESRETGIRQRSRLTWAVAAAAVVVIAAAAVAGITMRGDDSGTDHAPTAHAPATGTVTELTGPGDSAAKCAVPNPELLGQAQVAVDAVVTAVTDDQATLEPSHWYAGEATDVLRVAVPTGRIEVLFGTDALRVGGRYLLAANDGQLVVCGFSGPYDAQRAALYQEAFGG